VRTISKASMKRQIERELTARTKRGSRQLTWTDDPYMPQVMVAEDVPCRMTSIMPGGIGILVGVRTDITVCGTDYTLHDLWANRRRQVGMDHLFRVKATQKRLENERTSRFRDFMDDIVDQWKWHKKIKVGV
jgi:hypothetical protein